jgi:hypothetical protein
MPYTYVAPLKFVAGVDIRVMCTGDSAAASGIAEVHYRGFLETVV